MSEKKYTRKYAGRQVTPDDVSELQSRAFDHVLWLRKEFGNPQAVILYLGFLMGHGSVIMCDALKENTESMDETIDRIFEILVDGSKGVVAEHKKRFDRVPPELQSILMQVLKG